MAFFELSTQALARVYLLQVYCKTRPHLNLSYVAVWLAGVLQTGLYADFFYYYFKSWKRNEKLKLPA